MRGSADARPSLLTVGTFLLTAAAIALVAKQVLGPVAGEVAAVDPLLPYLPLLVLPLAIWCAIKLTTLFGGGARR